jgi:hypothetical protein
VKEYVDRLLEEVSEDQATALKNTDSEMILKDTKLRYLMQFDDLFAFYFFSFLLIIVHLVMCVLVHSFSSSFTIYLIIYSFLHFLFSSLLIYFLLFPSISFFFFPFHFPVFRSLREEIDRERKGQETVLKDLKLTTSDNNNTATSNNNNSKSSQNRR